MTGSLVHCLLSCWCVIAAVNLFGCLHLYIPLGFLLFISRIYYALFWQRKSPLAVHHIARLFPLFPCLPLSQVEDKRDSQKWMRAAWNRGKNMNCGSDRPVFKPFLYHPRAEWRSLYLSSIREMIAPVSWRWEETRFGKHWLNQEPALSTCLFLPFPPLNGFS